MKTTLPGKKIAIIGAGKVGMAIGHILQRKGLDISAVASRSRESLDRANQYISSPKFLDINKAAESADIIFLTTNDDQIEPACQQIARSGGFREGSFIFHMSGALSIGVLEVADKCGALTGCIHPLQSFATIKGAIEQLPNSVFGITGDERVKLLAKEIVNTLGGTAIVVRNEDKPLYHAAACVASNYFVGLIHYAQSIYKSMGISDEMALQAMLPLIKGTLANFESQGTTKALTGPIARGDMEPLEEHLNAFEQRMPDKKKLYCELGKYVTQVALEKGTVNEDKQKELFQLFQGGSHEQESDSKYLG